MLFLNDLIFLLPEIYWACLVILVLLYGAFTTITTKKILINSLGWFTIFTLSLFIYVYTQLPATEYVLLNYQYGLDEFSYYFRISALFLLGLVVYFSLGYFFLERVFFTEYFFFFRVILSFSFFFSLRRRVYFFLFSNWATGVNSLYAS